MADGGLSEFFEPAEGKTAFDDPEQEWYFDLPSGAWERQEQKNRELRQTVKRNVSERDGASVPFARSTPAPRRSVAWKSAGGTWGLNQPQAGEESGVGPAPLRVPRKEGDEPSSSRWNSAVGTYEAAPTRAEDDEDEAQADADDSVVGRMGSSANARSEGETTAATGGPVPLLRRDGRPSAGDADPGSGSMWGGAFGESEPPTKRRVLAAAPLAREGEEAPAVRWISGSLPAGDAPRRGNLWMGADDAASGEEPARPRRNLFAEAVGEGPVPPVPAVEAVPESPAWLDEPYGPEDEPDTTGEDLATLEDQFVVVEIDDNGDEGEEAPAFLASGHEAPVALEPIAEPAAPAAVAASPGGGLSALPLLRRSLEEEAAPEATTSSDSGEPTSRWDQVFAGQAVGGDLIDAMRDWLVHEKEEEARARDITLLPAELLQPFEWENDPDDAPGVTFEAESGAGISVASLAGHIWLEAQPAAASTAQAQPAEDVAAAWRAPVPEEAWEPGPDLARITAPSPGDVSEGEQWGGSSWAELAPAASRDGTKKKGGLLGRLFGKGSKAEVPATGPEWAMGGPSAWTAPSSASHPPAPLEPAPRPDDWAPVEDAAPVLPEWTPPPVLTPEPSETLAAAEAPAPALRRDWDDGWFELPGDLVGPPGNADAHQLGLGRPDVTAGETTPTPLFAAAPDEPQNESEAGFGPGGAAVAGDLGETATARPALSLVPAAESGEDDPWAAFIAAREEEETPFRFTSEGDARRTGSLG